MAGRSGDVVAQDPRWELVANRERDELGRQNHVALPRDGARFGSLVVLRSVADGKRSRVTCRCDCGGEWTGEPRQLRRGPGRCGACGHKKPDMARRNADLFPDPVVRAAWGHRYSGMVSRCYDPDHAAYPNYGGRGITVHKPWLRDRRKFFEFALTLDGWALPNLDLDRIDNERGYEPGNLRLVSRSESSSNRRATVFLTFEGVELPFAEFWSRFCPEWHRNAITHHLDRGRSPEWIVAHYRATRGRV